MSKETKHFYEFGPFRIDPDKRLLLRDNRSVPLQPKAFETLLVLVEHSETVVLKDDLMKSVWPDTFVEESNLAQNIFVLRKTLGDAAGEHRYIVTVPGRGYRFTERVRLVPDEDDIVMQSRSITRVLIDEQSEEKSSPHTTWRWAGLVGAVIVAVLGGTWYWWSPRGPKLTGKDTIVLADFSNHTGDPVFDDTLRTALSVALAQSPFLNVLSDHKVGAVLRMMTRAPDTTLTADVALEVCQRAGSKAYIAGSISRLGNQYVLSLEAVNCQTGDTVVQEQATGATKEKVLDALGDAAARLRSKLGESLATVQKFDAPLAKATTPSLEALKAYSLSWKFLYRQDPAAALPYSQRAIDLDPGFAMAYEQMGITYFGLNEVERASEAFTKAFQLRDRASEWEKLEIDADYYGYATGELDRAVQALQVEIEIYHTRQYNMLVDLYSRLGQYEKSSEAARTMIQLDPDNTFGYVNLAAHGLALQRPDQAQQAIEQAHARKLDDYLLHEYLYTLAFIRMDSARMAEQQRWFADQPVYENYGLALAADTEAYAGHLNKAGELARRAVISAMRADNKEDAAIYEANGALEEAAYGNASKAKQLAAEALGLARAGRGVEAEAALAFAMSGETAQAESLVQDLNKRFPRDTQIQSLWLPGIRAQLELNKKNPPAALSILQAALPVEFANIPFGNNTSCLYHTYLRGEAYLAARQGAAAAAEFQKIIDHSGIVWNCWTGALAHLGVARANALQPRTLRGADADAANVRALATYKDFLTLWKDADPGIPILKQAKTEYEKLQ